MATTSHTDVRSVLDNAKLGAMQITAMVVCFIVIALDGFDTQSIAFVAPTLRQTWEVSPELFGPLFAAGLLGTLVGSIAFGSVADRFGRKPMLLASTALFGAMTLACSTAGSIEQLGIYRFVAGLVELGRVPVINEVAPDVAEGQEAQGSGGDKDGHDGQQTASFLFVAHDSTSSCCAAFLNL